MVQSMTGFGRSDVQRENQNITVEMKTVKHCKIWKNQLRK